ncbi:MBL fold metallo-hydrolase [candidate division WOR-3 bacterium]|uniref:MBL fold metallo-hydrolase n=1 Tax=candidate division WOR-3 bacterium TaxID=2052148 RepID=A0A9D5QEZ3_UNCW3|nr:MBL fold metallo-hydrolase [candidate division WOR-3 bacterium]MBD3365490.1 MBL fold metallo-hydrolase [candidate division WOR-3 bacterium]
MYIKFLGTGGARYVVAKQLRYSAGIFLHACGQNVMIDPGPGTLVRMAKSKPRIDIENITAVIATHSHIDHINDINILIDAMTEGGDKKRGRLFAPRECLEGEDAVIFSYLRNFPEDIVTLEEKTSYEIGDLKFTTSIRHRHTAETYGLIFSIEGKKVSFLPDTGFFDGLRESYAQSDVLIVNTVLRSFKPGASERHLSFDDLETLIELLSPGKLAMTHFGMGMLKARPWELAQELSGRSGIEVIAASDGMRLDL